MGGHTDLAQTVHEELAQQVVQNALAFDHVLLLGVEGGGVILKILHDGARLGSFEQGLRLAFVDFLATCHGQPFGNARDMSPREFAALIVQADPSRKLGIRNVLPQHGLHRGFRFVCLNEWRGRRYVPKQTADHSVAEQNRTTTLPLGQQSVSRSSPNRRGSTRNRAPQMVAQSDFLLYNICVFSYHPVRLNQRIIVHDHFRRSRTRL